MLLQIQRRVVPRQHRGVFHVVQLQPGIEEVRLLETELEADVSGDEESCCTLLADLIGQGYRILEFRPRRADLEHIFMTVTKGDVQ